MLIIWDLAIFTLQQIRNSSSFERKLKWFDLFCYGRAVGPAKIKSKQNICASWIFVNSEIRNDGLYRYSLAILGQQHTLTFQIKTKDSKKIAFARNSLNISPSRKPRKWL